MNKEVAPSAKELEKEKAFDDFDDFDELDEAFDREWQNERVAEAYHNLQHFKDGLLDKNIPYTDEMVEDSLKTFERFALFTSEACNWIRIALDEPNDDMRLELMTQALARLHRVFFLTDDDD